MGKGVGRNKSGFKATRVSYFWRISIFKIYNHIVVIVKHARRGDVENAVGGDAIAVWNGDRRHGLGMAILANAFPLMIDGFDQHADAAAFLHDALLDNITGLDPVCV